MISARRGIASGGLAIPRVIAAEETELGEDVIEGLHAVFKRCPRTP